MLGDERQDVFLLIVKILERCGAVLGDPGAAVAAAARISWDTPGGDRTTVETSTPTQVIAELATHFGEEVPAPRR
jgi:hypothetical protein